MFFLANRLQVPSYISLGTALSFHGITTQIQQGFFESIAITRTKTIEVKSVQFEYTKIQKNLYFGFTKEKDFFIASPEKAFLDSLYLMSLGRYRLDIDSLDIAKLSKKGLKELVQVFPPATKKLLENYAGIKRA